MSFEDGPVLQPSDLQPVLPQLLSCLLDARMRLRRAGSDVDLPELVDDVSEVLEAALADELLAERRAFSEDSRAWRAANEL